MKAPFKVVCFSWLVARNAYLTHDKLQRRGFQLCSRCFLCGAAGENNSHLFIHCPVTGQLWQLFLNMAETNWTMPEHTADLWSSWIRRGGSKSQKAWLRIIPYCIWWTFWKERNSRNFEDRSNSIEKVKGNCIVSFYFWCKEKDLEETEQIVELLGSLQVFFSLFLFPLFFEGHQHILNAKEYNITILN
ncbi:hypothetical protein MTR67_031255 [Solanum verrucosum]|uniref:Reverse transcriptase zinc-binding domain-containing protein n=1 Tax=Solanum verrucosum TaxID=315347 RepID=A0AAF0U234_SOLVR|nr:hypothetical protein MTR67_031255 [Solanum verrucosum]